MKTNSIWFGIVLGVCVPILGFALMQILFEQLAAFGLVDEASTSISSRRMRTLSLLGICCIIIPFEMARRNRWDHSLRGMVFPIVLYVLIWLYYFRDSFMI